MNRTIGTSVYGLRAPILKQGDNLENIVVNTLLNSDIEIKDKDVLGITESIVARCGGNYVTVDEVAEDIKKKFSNPENIHVYKPIYSRNRFAMILKAIARAVKDTVFIVMPDIDEVGNVLKNHPFTGLDYDEYYKNIVEAEDKKCVIEYINDLPHSFDDVLDCQLHKQDYTINLARICEDKCEYGLLGSNKSSEEVLKLFPSTEYAKELVNNIQKIVKQKTGKTIEVMIYGDGCFKDPVGGIWEFADPVVSPAYTSELEGTPNEIKIKNFADEKFKDLSGEDLDNAIKQEIQCKNADLKGNMYSQGTTPRRYTDLLGSLMDLTSGSGDKGTPFVYVQGYFDNLASE